MTNENEIGFEDEEAISEWVSLEPQPYRFETEGQTLEGRFLGSANIEIRSEPVTRHSFDSVSHPAGPVYLFGSTVMDSRLEALSPGDYVRLTYDGLSENAYRGGNRARMYSVQRLQTRLL